MFARHAENEDTPRGRRNVHDACTHTLHRCLLNRRSLDRTIDADAVIMPKDIIPRRATSPPLLPTAHQARQITSSDTVANLTQAASSRRRWSTTNSPNDSSFRDSKD